MRIFVYGIFIIFCKLIASDEMDFHLVDIEDTIPTEQEFKRTYETFIGENPKSQPVKNLSQLLKLCSSTSLNSASKECVPILLKGLHQPYATWQEKQSIAMYFLSRKKEGEGEYYLTEEQRRQIAAIIMAYLLNPTTHISKKILEAMMIFDTEALRKKEGEYIFKTEKEEARTAIILNCNPQLVTFKEFDTMAGSLMDYVFDKTCTESERYARYVHCEMWKYTGFHFTER